MVVKLWDGFIRGFHWLLLFALIGLWYTGGNLEYIEVFGVFIEFIDVHHKLGLFVLALVLTRILWGFFGSESGRFSHFVRGPKAIVAYLRRPFAKEHLTHNPGGGIIVLLMLAVLLAQAVTGLFTDDAIFFRGPLASTVSDSTVSLLTSYHKQAFDYLLLLIALHIIAILVYAAMRKNLIGPMITGNKKIKAESAHPPKQVHGGFGFLLLAINFSWIFWWLG